MCRVIAIANQKGGVGKTTTAMNLGIGLVKAGKNVLLIDADAQGNLTSGMGVKDHDSLTQSLSTVLTDVINRDEEEGFDPEKAVMLHEEGVFFIPGNIELCKMEESLVNTMNRERIMQEYIGLIKNKYDYILIDCTPSLGMITVNALSSADRVLIPMQAAFFSLKGLEQLIQTIGRVKRKINPKLSIEGVLITMVDNRTVYDKDITTLLEQSYGEKLRIFDTKIPKSVRASEAPAAGVSIFKHDPKGKVAQAYEALTREVLKNG